MNYVLSIYSYKAFKEHLMPAINNADYTISLPGNLFGFSDDLEIDMEILDGKWRILPSEKYEFAYTATKTKYISEILKDGDVLTGALWDGLQVSIVVKETNTSFSVYEKYDLNNVNTITIGKNSQNTIVYNNLNLVSGEHATISAKAGNRHVVTNNSANGVFVNSKRIAASYELSVGDCIDIFGLRLVYFRDFLAINIQNAIVNTNILSAYDFSLEQYNHDINKVSKAVFRRSPRNIEKIEYDRIEIEGPTAPKEIGKQSAFLTIGPSVTMALPMMLGCALSVYSTKMHGGTAGAFMYTGLVTAVGSAIVGTIWAVVNMKNNRKRNEEEENIRVAAYGEYLNKISDLIQRRYMNNANSLLTMYPDAETVCSYGVNSIHLWNRNNRHEDFMSYRLGLGSIPFQAEIDIPKERFTLVNDELSDYPKELKEKYAMLHNVPVNVDLMNNKIVGIVGGKKRRNCYSVVHNLVAQIAASNCYTDVKMAFVFDENQEDSDIRWGFSKWLPHTWSEDKKTRFVAGNKTEASEVFYEITKKLRIRSEENSLHYGKKKIPKPYYILFLESPELLEGELISKYVYDVDSNCGITTIMLAAGYEDLPNECEYILYNTERFTGIYKVNDGIDDRIAINFDKISWFQLENFARRLANIEVREMENGGEIPNMLTFFEMYGVKSLSELSISERWKKNRTYESIKALIGQKAGGADCYLDVHEKYHGPHGLIAGTTGSGKSETLQTYLLSLAVNYSPDDVNFFIIDYKGGGMANLFDSLPHVVGQISNLSGNQVRRAMVSIKSENVRRQKIFNEYGVNNINHYTRLFKNGEASVPIPHLFIIIDEFAELKREEPDFMRELISVAQVGRSLGVHLILATQKPNGTVDDNIWSNSKFRLCLRVQDRQDSTDMLHRPDAAYITQAGRCYLQVGNDELFELFQSAWSGAVYDDEHGISQTNIAQMLSRDGKAALVGSHAKYKQKEQIRHLWIERLVTVIEQAANNMNIAIDTCIYDSNKIMKLIDKVYELLGYADIEYADTDYNRNRIQDLLAVYVEERYGECRSNSNRDIVANIIMKANLDGKKLPEVKEKTQLDAIVEYLGILAQSMGYNNNLQLWLPVLPECIYLEELTGYAENAFDGTNWKYSYATDFTLETIIGLYDDPVNQAQRPITIDVANSGNCALVGTVTSGKSTFLTSYIYSLVNRYSPQYVNLYLLDYSSKALGAFEGLAHVGGVMYENDDETVSKFFVMMEKILDERKHLFKGGSYTQYIRANGVIVPAIVIVIDNVAAFRSKTNNLYEEVLIKLLKEGAGYGIFFVVTAAGFGLNEIPSRMSDSFRNILCLEMNDKFAYTDALRILHIDVLPEENIKGRGLTKIGDSVLEFQTALVFPADDDYKRGEMIRHKCEEMNHAWKGKSARNIPVIPEKPSWDEFIRLDEVQDMFRSKDLLPVGYDQKNAIPYGINLKNTYCYVISGKARTGKTNLIKNMMNAAEHLEGKIVVMDFSNELAVMSSKPDTLYIKNDQELFDYFMDISPVFKERNVKKKSYEVNGLSDIEIYEKMQEFEKIFIFITNLADFVQHVHEPVAGVGQMKSFLSTILEKGALHNVFWFAAYNQEDVAKTAGYEIYNKFTRNQDGIHLGGNVAAQRLFNFEHIVYAEQSKVQKTGIGMLPTHDNDETEMVVIPYHKGD